jgi:asparagine synthase (glutamine-hydrolysing)
VPLLDHLLLEDVMRLPGNLKLNGRQAKSLLVRSLPEPLPTGVTKGIKRGFTLPFADWLPGQLRTEVETTFAHQPPALEGVVNRDGVNAIWRAFLAGECSWTRPWALYVLYRTVENLLRPQSTPERGREPVTRTNPPSSSEMVLA